MTGAWIKFAVLVGLLGLMVVGVHLGGGLDLLEFDRMQAAIEDAGPWAPLAYIALYAVLTVATVPGTLLTVTGAALFPLGWAYLMVLVGAMLGACASFVLARALGREVVEKSLARAEGDFGEKLRGWTARVADNGLLAIAYLRLVYVPFPVLNYAAPLTGVRLRDFALGTLLGIIPGAFVFVFMGNTIQAAWESGSFAGIEPWQGIVSVALFGVSLVIPLILQRRFGSGEGS